MANTLLTDPTRAAALKTAAASLPSRDLTAAQVDDLELLLGGLLAPLRGYLGSADFDAVIADAQLANGTPWPLPLALETDATFADPLTIGAQIALRDPEGVILAILTLGEVYTRDGRTLLGGNVEGLALPLRYDHRQPRAAAAASSENAIALVTAKPLHRAAIAATPDDARLTIIAPLGGLPDPAPLLRVLSAALPEFPSDPATLALIPCPPPVDARDWLLQAIIANNLGYRTLLAQGDLSLAKQHAAAIGITVREIAYGTPEDSFPTVLAALRRANPPRAETGLTVFFTGLSGSGKSTIANILRVRLAERPGRAVSLLDGDLVRKNLSSELTFSKEHRAINILRIGYVAAEITKHGGIAICAPIAPYDAIRQQVRTEISAHGSFVLIHVATPLEVCEARDRKGLYALARAGKIKEFTGISDPYEKPQDAELVIQTTEMSAEEACDTVIDYLETKGYLSSAQV